MLFLAWRQLTSRKKQTLLILLGISFGTLLFVSISGVQLGFRTYIAEQLLNNTAHILISGAERTIETSEVQDALYKDRFLRWISPPSGKRDEVRLENYQGWYERLSANPEVIDFSPRLSAQAILANGKFTASANLIGTVPERHMRITSIEKYMKEGSFAALKGGSNHIVIGSGIAKELGTRINQYIRVTSGRGEERPYKVVGILHFGNEQVDETLAFAELRNVQVLTKSPGRVSEIAAALFDIDRAKDIAAEWRLLSKDKVQDWQEANKVFMEVIRVQDIVRYFITSSVLLVAAFGIYNVLTIMISQKRKEIAILRAIGYGPERIRSLVLYQGLMLGLGGGMLGLLLGYLLCRWAGSIDLGIELGGSRNLRISYDLMIYETAFLAANVAAIIASYLPAREAARMTPMEIIRSES